VQEEVDVEENVIEDDKGVTEAQEDQNPCSVVLDPHEVNKYTMIFLTIVRVKLLSVYSRDC
jgi:hypothetical protein